MSTYATVVCDVETTDTGRCMSEDTLPALASHANQVRAYLRRQGWHRTRDGRDICPDCWPENRPNTPSLAPRQAAVLAAAADGAPLSEVAARLGTTRSQIASRLSEAYRLLDVAWMPREQRRAAAVRIARRHGLIPADTNTRQEPIR